MNESVELSGNEGKGLMLRLVPRLSKYHIHFVGGLSPLAIPFHCIQQEMAATASLDLLAHGPA